jgi:hypothetical protein
MFSWGTTLGVYGSTLVARHFSENPQKESPAPLLPTGPFELRLDFPSLTLASTQVGWRLQVPFYFMISDVRRFRTKDGLDTDLVSLSTSFGQHADGKGRSQATIMFLHAKTPTCGDFDAFWLEQLGLDRSQKTTRSPLPSSGNYEAYDEKQRMRTELTTVPGSDGCYALAYLGVDGTFQANHVSYDDFIHMFGSETSNLGVRPPPPVTQPTGRGAR